MSFQSNLWHTRLGRRWHKSGLTRTPFPFKTTFVETQESGGSHISLTLTCAKKSRGRSHHSWSKRIVLHTTDYNRVVQKYFLFRVTFRDTGFGRHKNGPAFNISPVFKHIPFRFSNQPSLTHTNRAAWHKPGPNMLPLQSHFSLNTGSGCTHIVRPLPKYFLLQVTSFKHTNSAHSHESGV